MKLFGLGVAASFCGRMVTPHTWCAARVSPDGARTVRENEKERESVRLTPLWNLGIRPAQRLIQAGCVASAPGRIRTCAHTAPEAVALSPELRGRVGRGVRGNGWKPCPALSWGTGMGLCGGGAVFEGGGVEASARGVLGVVGTPARGWKWGKPGRRGGRGPLSSCARRVRPGACCGRQQGHPAADQGQPRAGGHRGRDRGQSGAECLDVVHHVRPDVVTLDVVMPRLDGLRTAARLHADAGPGTFPSPSSVPVRSTRSRAARPRR